MNTFISSFVLFLVFSQTSFAHESPNYVCEANKDIQCIGFVPAGVEVRGSCGARLQKYTDYSEVNRARAHGNIRPLSNVWVNIGNFFAAYGCTQGEQYRCQSTGPATCQARMEVRDRRRGWSQPQNPWQQINNSEATAP